MESARLKEAVVKAQNGSQDALQDLYLDSYKSVYYLALKILRNPDDAEDVTQEVFITVQQHISDLKEPAAYYKWLNQITNRRCLNYIRDKKPLAGDEADEAAMLEKAEDDAFILPDKAFDDAETRRIIIEVIDGLPIEQRYCIMAYYYGQLTIAQIAEESGINANTIKSRLRMGRNKIRTALDEMEKKDGIKLYGIPMALTPILRQAMQDFQVPQGLAERIWNNTIQTLGFAPGSVSFNGPSQNGQFESSIQPDTINAAQTEPGGMEGQASDTPGPGEPAQSTQAKGEANMSNQHGQYPQQGQQPQYPQGQNPYQSPGQPQGYPQQGQPYQPQGMPNAAPPPPAPNVAAQAGQAAVKAGMKLSTKIIIAAVAVVTAAALAVTGSIVVPKLMNNNASTGGNGASQSSIANSGIAVIGAPVQDGFAEEHEITIAVDGEEYTGTYEGEYADGLFNGHGVWICDNWHYDGNWENGVPNGEGSLYAKAPDGWSNGTGIEVLKKTYTGVFVDGLLHGDCVIRYLTANKEVDHAHEWTVNYDNGFYTETGAIECNMCETQMRFGDDAPHKQDDSMGVPPWAKMGIWWD